jgi:hypothetical protein
VKGRGRQKGDVPTVARPPNFMRPNRRKGTESVVTLGAISRITITSSGFSGTSLEDMVAFICCSIVVVREECVVVLCYQ